MIFQPVIFNFYCAHKMACTSLVAGPHVWLGIVGLIRWYSNRWSRLSQSGGQIRSGSPIRVSCTGRRNQIVLYAYQICSVTHNDHHKSIIIACSQKTVSQRIQFPLGFPTICDLVLWIWGGMLRQGPGWHSLFLLLCSLCRKAEREQSSITTKLSSRLRGRGQVVVICVICNRLSNPSSNPAHNTDCGAL